MFSIFIKGGPVMWPLLITSFVALTVAFERLLFLVKEHRLRDLDAVSQILTYVEHGRIDEAISLGQRTQDFVATILAYGLVHRNDSLSSALLLAANKSLKRFSHGISILDTIITLAPLLGLFGTVTGMIRAFGLLGTTGLDAQAAITGGIAEALIATAFGLLIAMVALLPFNYLNSRVEEARHEIEDAATYLELLVLRTTKPL